MDEGAILSIHDPKVEKKQIFREFDDIKDSKVFAAKSAFEAANGADAVLIMTDWEEFQYIDWKSIYKVMRKPAWVFDTRSIISIEEIQETNINFWQLGNGEFN